MNFSEIEVAVDGVRAGITLNRPDKLNPLSTTTLNELVEAARQLDTRSGVKVVVISGRGRAFSDADSLVTALGDSESRAAAEAYLMRLGRR